MIVTAIGLQYYVFAESFFDQWYNDTGGWHAVDINIYSLLNALYGISAVLITFGGLIGKISPIQLVVLTVVELTLHALNYKVFMTGILNVADAGGTYVDHMFGAYFGLAVAYILGPPVHIPDMGTVPDLFSLLGTLFLWVYWPSFVAGAGGANSSGQQRAIVNTILALSASTVSAFWASSFFSTNARFRPVDIQNATLAGGVAIGTVSNWHLGPFGAIMIGLTCGCWSTFGYNIIMPILEANHLHDTCGIHNLHGMPSVIGALASVFLAAYQGEKGASPAYESVFGDTAGSKQWWHQLLGIFLCMSFAIFTGVLTGYLLKFIDPVDPTTEKVEKDPHFKDDVYWDVADDFGRTLYVELLKLVENDPEHGHLSKEEVDDLKHGVEDLSGHGGRFHAVGDNALQASNHSKEGSAHGSNHGVARHPVLHAVLDPVLHKDHHHAVPAGKENAV